MEFIIFGIIILGITLMIGIVFEINMKKIASCGDNKKLDEIADKYPENIDMCKEYLEMLKNKNVKIEENKEAKTTLYIAIQNKILIANLKQSYTRIQTIAHECIHSTQNRNLLMFNFIFSNLYIIYFLVISILTIFKVLPAKELFLAGLIFMSMIYCLVRNYLENDAMIKARFLAEKYLNKKNISNDEEKDELLAGFDKINNIGIKYVNFSLFFNCIIKTFFYSIICGICK